MRILWVALLASCAPRPVPDEADDPLRPLARIARELDRGIAEFLAGKSPVDSFPAWRVNPRGAEKLRAQLLEAKVASATNLGFQLDLRLYRDDTCVFVVSAFVYADAGGAALVKVSSRREEPPPPGAPGVLDDDADLEDLVGPDRPFAEAARSLRRGLAGARILDADRLKTLLPDSKLRRDALDDLAKARGRLETAAKGVAEARAGRLLVRVDDQVFLARDASGRLVGTIAGDFDSPPGGRVAFRLKDYTPLAP